MIPSTSVSTNRGTSQLVPTVPKSRQNLAIDTEVKNKNDSYYNEKQWTFNDGQRTIDYVLVYGEPESPVLNIPTPNMPNIPHVWSTSPANAENERKVYEFNLMQEGLDLEHEFVADTGLHFVKIHIPLPVLKRYAEILKLRMPLKNRFKTILESPNENQKPKKKCCSRLRKYYELEPLIFPPYKEDLTTTYTQAKDYLFDVKSPVFFIPAIKSGIVKFILERASYTQPDPEDSDVFKFGIARLIMHGVYIGAYPLHDGDWQTPGSFRYKFYHHWASYKLWHKHQPADQIMQYFGVKVAFYFLWVGHYTRMLVPATVAGLTCFFISLFVIDQVSLTVDEVCEDKIQDLICPLCDYHCHFWKPAEYCFEAKVLKVFDNFTTVMYATFMCFWAAIYLERWKRYSSKITLRWNLTEDDHMDETIRPEYAARLSKLASDKKTGRLNFLTNVVEPKASFWKDIFPGKCLSLTGMILLLLLPVSAVISVILYKMFAMAALRFGPIPFLTSKILYLCSMLILSPIYKKMSVFLTELEMHRTQPEFYNSLIIKLFVLEFINNYTYIFYIAFIKGKFVGSPSGYNRIFGYRNLECTGGSCMMELTEQLLVIMIGKKVYKSFSKIFLPIVSHKWRKISTAAGLGDARSQWEKDFLLLEESSRALFYDKVDMVIQYGFVTLFASALPLAPLMALVNNIFEMRIVARKLVVYYRRPTFKQVAGIGVWTDILAYISFLAVVTNGLIIAFTSNFIPRLMYKLAVKHDFAPRGFLNFSLSYIAIEDLDMFGKPNTTAKYCRYLDFREPPWSDRKYEHSDMFWKVLAARLIFFVLFENLILLSVLVVKWLIPDVPQNVKFEMHRRHHLVKEMVIAQESTQQAGWFKRWLFLDNSED